jgi:hypothetical protein
VVRETFSHALRKILLGVFISTIAFILQWSVFKLRNWTDTEKVISTILGAAAIVIVGSFLVNAFRVPAELQKEMSKRFRSEEVTLREETDRLRRECSDLKAEVKGHLDKKIVPKVILVYNSVAQSGEFRLLERAGVDATNITVSPIVNGTKSIRFRPVDRIFANTPHTLVFWQEDAGNANVAIPPFNAPGNPIHRALDWLCLETASFENPMFTAGIEVSFDADDGRTHYSQAFELRYDGVSKELSLLLKR